MDDLAGIGGGVSTLTNRIPVPYKDLYFQAFRAGNVMPNPPVIGLRPNTGNFDAYTTSKEQTTDGTPMLSVNYPMTNVTAFDLISFWYGCSISLDSSVVTPPQSCTLTITGYVGSANTIAGSTAVVAQTFQYNPTTNTGVQDLAYAPVSPAFRGLQFVVFQFTINNTPALQTDLLGAIDTVKYTTYNCSSA